MSWKAESTANRSGYPVTYLRSQGHGHEGAHEIDVNGRIARILPGGPRSTAWRSRAISDALGVAEEMTSSGIDVDPMVLLVGSMVLGGVTEIEIDGKPIVDRPASVGQWNVMLTDDGRVEANWLGT